MGEAESTPIRFSFNGSLRVEGRGHHLSADAGALLLREVDERLLHLTAFLSERLTDERDPGLVTYSLAELVRTRLYGLALGHRHQDDMDHLRFDPALRASVDDGRGVTPVSDDGGHLASQPTLSRLVETVSGEENLEVLSEALVEGAKRDVLAHRGGPLEEATLDVDSFAVEVHGHQAGSVYNGHYGMRCYHPLVTFLSETAHCLSADLRPGNVHTAQDAGDHVLKVVDRVENGLARVTAVRGDAGFPSDPLLATLEERAVHYVFRLRTNVVLERLAKPYLRRPPGRPPNDPRVWTYDLEYQAKSWCHPRRVVLVVLERPDELFLDHFFLVTSYAPRQKRGRTVLEFYRQRGTMEQHLGEFQTVLDPALSSTTRPKNHYRGHTPKTRYASRDPERANAANFRLLALAYNLLNSARRVEDLRNPRHKCTTALRCLRNRLLKVAARISVSARRATFTVNEVVATAWSRFLESLRRLAPT